MNGVKNITKAAKSRRTLYKAKARLDLKLFKLEIGTAKLRSVLCGDPRLGHSGPSQQDTGMGIQAANGQDLIYSIKHLIILQIYPLAFSSRHLIIDSDKCL